MKIGQCPGGPGLDGLRKFDALKLDRVRVVALVLVLAVALVEDVVDLVDEQVDGLVHLLGLGGAVDVGAADFHLGLGDKLVGVVVLAIALEFNADPHDVGFVTKQSLHLLLNVIFQGLREVEMNAGHNNFVGTI